MSQVSDPSMGQWSRLYDAAERFKKMACWEWMYDSDLFGVRNPRTGEVGYCCVMGRGGEFFSMAVYPGTPGLEVIDSKFEGTCGPGNADAAFVQDCIMVSFDGREALDPADHKVIKDLGLKFRGKTDWPLFRRHKPGYVPWFLEPEDVDFLTIALEQAMEVAPRVKITPDLLRTGKDGLFLVRVAESDNGDFRWRDEWLAPVPYLREPAESPVNENLLKRTRRRIKRREGVWMFDLFHSSFTITDVEPHYFPLMGLWIDAKSGMILGFEMTAPHDGTAKQNDKFLELVGKSGVCPKEVVVMRERAVDMVVPLARALEFEVLLAERLPPLEEAREHMLKFMSGGF